MQQLGRSLLNFGRQLKSLVQSEPVLSNGKPLLVWQHRLYLSDEFSTESFNVANNFQMEQELDKSQPNETRNEKSSRGFN